MNKEMGQGEERYLSDHVVSGRSGGLGIDCLTWTSSATTPLL